MKTIASLLDLVGFLAVSAFETLFLGKSVKQQTEDASA